MSLLDIIEYRDDVSVVHGVVVGIVTNNKDPDGIGRVKVKFPWLSTDDESAWARVASPMAGKERGIFILPEVDDEVLVVFEHGDVNMPYVIGSLWNGVDLPPETNSDGKNNIRMIKSRSGHTITIDDTEGTEKIEIADKTGNNTITIDTKSNKLSFKSDKDIEISAPNGKISINANDFEVKASTSAKVEASTGMDLKASGTMNIKGATVNIN
ncbi:MAG: phage tail protein [Candidatus Methanogaster sp.]|uniref:Phage tail protein n=1 Tax=Candidatus Methanogaster sp. TaxID=3386292 RepID=A0AC61L3Q6_9EURY|nr:MAG: phage tail protein [ANME-2 cluster archaeon]